MAVTFVNSANWFVAADPTVTVSFSAGDEIVVFGATEATATTLATPTATGLTFSAITSATAGASEPTAYLWRATAGAGGTSVVITAARGGSNGTQMAGLAAWVIGGGVTSVSALAGDNAESGYASVSAPSGGMVIVALADWNATNPPGKTPSTGTGTATERFDTGNTSNYAVWGADWQGTTTSSATYGPNNYTSLRVAKVGAAITLPGGGGAAGARSPIVTDPTALGVIRRRFARLVLRAPHAPAPPRRPLVSGPSRRPPGAGRAIAITPRPVQPSVPPPRRPLVLAARRIAAAGRVLMARAPQPPAPPHPPIVTTGRRPATAGRSVVRRGPLAPPQQQPPRAPIVAAGRRALRSTGRSLLRRTAQAPPAPSGVSLLGTWALPSADPHSITITGATAGLDVWLLVNTAAVVATPAGWTLTTSRVATMASYIYQLPAASNPGGDIAVTLDLSAARALSAVAIQAAPIDSGSVYASLLQSTSTDGGLVWGTRAHTFTAKDDTFAVYFFHMPGSAGSVPSFTADSYDTAFTPFADTGWAGTGTSGDEGTRVMVGYRPDIGFTNNGVTLTLAGASGPFGSAVGFLAFNEQGIGTTAVQHGPLVIATRRALTAGRAMVARSPLAPAPPRPPIVVGARRRPGLGRILLERAPQAAPATPTRRPQPIVVVARARARAQEILNLRAPAAPADVVSVPAAAQVTEPRSRRPVTRPAIVTRNRTAAPGVAVGPREPLVITSTRRPLARIILRRTPPGAALVAQAPRRPLVVTGQRPRPQTRVAVRRSPAAPLVSVVRPRVLVVAARVRRRPTVNVLLWSAPPPPPAPPGPGAQWYVSRGGTLIPHRALLDGVYPTTADVT